MVQAELSASVPGTDAGERQGRNHLLFNVLYDELHRVASRELRRNAHAPLSPTTLLHETFLSFSAREPWGLADRGRFMAYAVRAMRGLIIDCLRRGSAKKRGGEFEIVALPEELPENAEGGIEVEKLREALDTLGSIDPRLAECVDLKFFCGFSSAQIAQMWNVTERTVQRDWDKARVILKRLIGGAGIETWGIS